MEVEEVIELHDCRAQIRCLGNGETQRTEHGQRLALRQQQADVLQSGQVARLAENTKEGAIGNHPVGVGKVALFDARPCQHRAPVDAEFVHQRQEAFQCRSAHEIAFARRFVFGAHGAS